MFDVVGGGGQSHISAGRFPIIYVFLIIGNFHVPPACMDLNLLRVLVFLEFMQLEKDLILLIFLQENTHLVLELFGISNLL